MTNLKSILALLVATTSSVAMADGSFTAKGSVTIGAPAPRARPVVIPPPAPVVRDHRTERTERDRYERYDRDDRGSGDRGYNDRDHHDHWSRDQQPSSVFIANQGCQNWDPTLVASPCGGVISITPPQVPGFRVIATRDSAMAAYQVVSLPGQTMRKVHIEPLTGSPKVTQIGVRFADGSLQTIDIPRRTRKGAFTIDLDGRRRAMTEIVFYTKAGSTGLYTMYAR